ncbi:hypothetical protein KP509_33G065000 [Ceratopteris richardii]|uniref:Uncharacterized protein n=1 Tax=Ceratopteris richardii TaxID=49495 RepID=A0A8T2QRM3_CERRI|nr:hypothetical protein KP509_33G065000 [Ceratopteris richardii]KAH7286229.1 hypothetical protein KP509_33G065000 [Ceratopteris richardii]KAH7286230.1 hypothetical protein KP509_33G065000 [Ceratopteris richardii]
MICADDSKTLMVLLNDLTFMMFCGLTILGPAGEKMYFFSKYTFRLVDLSDLQTFEVCVFFFSSGCFSCSTTIAKSGGSIPNRFVQFFPYSVEIQNSVEVFLFILVLAHHVFMLHV